MTAAKKGKRANRQPEGRADSGAVHDAVNHPRHYTSHASGVECIQITEHLGFCRGNAIKYIWRAGERPEREVEDLRKAIWYLEREVQRLTRPIPYELAEVAK